MNTRLVMTSSAIVLVAVGILFTFAPELLLNALTIPLSNSAILLGQLFGGLYFGFAMLNWMAKGTRMGGIYNRPIVVGNFAHFFVVSMALIKALVVDAELPYFFWIGAAVYGLFAIAFGLILFRSPVE